ncbi:Inherit from KOG: CD2 (cytoplasmic tail) binding protein 2 [Seminavis robusta]|uniref:Inherit from KOG: CD2 (Cytoplasmic tail) binding protein 2 n=1 Tax=Seminavis robusta TaxID=568900 RepID=A0A9N8EGS3_9STRA|nr:Inherit from KOG: CD2 (cytoplasmic tail) binding protein 2 [Seminavis robusta]|eukprot:Sro1177_g249440.1 Inherit from KOG: CD2 (cytoplasmic tail) binding protein 2 (425) ;mRNA; f:26611-27885
MSSTSKKSSSSSKSVRFSAESKPEAPKRSRDDSDDDEDIVSHKRVLKKKRTDQMNEDEMDDVDDWNEDDEEDDGLPSIREREKAKRARRNNREHGTEEDDDDDEGGGMESTSIDERTSLASEGIQIEPFHMKQEQSDGTGFFDGDTYIFRKRDADEEPDAWLESLKDKPSTKSSTLEDASSDDAESDSMIQSESLTKEEWYAKILNLVSDTETIMQAVIRYGSLLKRKPLKRNKAKKHEADNASTNSNTEENPQASEAFQFAQTSLNDLTEAANALLGMGDVDIYQKTRNDLLKLMPSNNSNSNEEDKDDTDLQNQQSADKTKPKVSWEYKGSQDGQIHGPYTSEQMRDWTQAGYFVGVQAVQIRSVKEEEAKEKDLGEDLLADLMDDDDDDDDEDKDSGKQGEKKMVQGEWVLSDSVNFGSYC